MYVLYRMETLARHVRSQTRFSTGFSALPRWRVSHQAVCWGQLSQVVGQGPLTRHLSPLSDWQGKGFLLARTGVMSLSAGETVALSGQVWLRNNLLEETILCAAPASRHGCLVEAAFSFLLPESPVVPLPKKALQLRSVRAPPVENAEPISHMFLLPDSPLCQRLALTLGISKQKRLRAVCISGSE